MEYHFVWKSQLNTSGRWMREGGGKREGCQAARLPRAWERDGAAKQGSQEGLWLNRSVCSFSPLALHTRHVCRWPSNTAEMEWLRADGKRHRGCGSSVYTNSPKRGIESAAELRLQHQANEHGTVRKLCLL